MKLTLLCNAGLLIEAEGSALLVDVPNSEIAPFYRLPDEVWQSILQKKPPYDRVCGFWFTHDHPDHFDRERMMQYLAAYPQTPVFLPGNMTTAGRVKMGPFLIEYCKADHAPIPQAPPHVISLISVGEYSLYLPADAALEPNVHLAFLRGRKTDAAVWNAMYLSRSDTRNLMQQVSKRNFIYHMPEQKPDPSGLWRKLETNFSRYGQELSSVTVLESYPSEIEI